MITKFELNEKEETEIKEWQDSIKKIYGEYGLFDYVHTKWYWYRDKSL